MYNSFAGCMLPHSTLLLLAYIPVFAAFCAKSFSNGGVFLFEDKHTKRNPPYHGNKQQTPPATEVLFFVYYRHLYVVSSAFWTSSHSLVPPEI
jgi:hypothetical protein